MGEGMKKGIMFSFIMTFLTITLLTLITIQTSLVSHRREQLFIETRINSMNSLYDSIVRDVDKSLKIISRRAMVGALNNISAEGQELTEANETLTDLIFYGTLGGSTLPIMENATFTDWINKMIEVSDLKGFNTDINVVNLVVKPYDSFNLVVESDMNINITDQQGVARMSKSVSVFSIVDIEDLDDPLYKLYTAGLGSNMVEKSPSIVNHTRLILTGTGGGSFVYGEVTNDTSDFDDKILVVHNVSEVPGGVSSAKGVISEEDVVAPVPYVVYSTALSLISSGTNVLLDGSTGNVWFIDDLKEDTENSYYHPSENGPSYLDRLEGKLYIQSKYANQQPGKNIGLESFVNKNVLWAMGITVIEDKTNIDYIYFSTSSPSFNRVKGLDSTFRIDDEDDHQYAYNVTDLLY